MSETTTGYLLEAQTKTAKKDFHLKSSLLRFLDENLTLSGNV